jgi:hypothetical protein
VTLASYKTLGLLKYGLEFRPQYAFTAFRALLSTANYYAENIHYTNNSNATTNSAKLKRFQRTI